MWQDQLLLGGVMKYDPGLCIVCEKCVTVCKDMIGSNALSTVKRGADAIEKHLKMKCQKMHMPCGISLINHLLALRLIIVQIVVSVFQFVLLEL